MKKIFMFSIFFVSLISFSQKNSIPYTQEDRDRAVRTETKVDNLEKRLDDTKSDLNSRIDNESLKTESQFDRVFTLFNIVIGMIVFLIGFQFWDRQTATKPLKDKYEKIEKVLQELARKDADIAAVMRREGLMT